MRTVSVNFLPENDTSVSVVASRSFPDYGYTINVTWSKSFDRHDVNVLKNLCGVGASANEISLFLETHQIDLNRLAQRVVDCLLMEPSNAQILEIIRIQREYNKSKRAIVEAFGERIAINSEAIGIMELALFECKLNSTRYMFYGYMGCDYIEDFFDEYFTSRGFTLRPKPKKINSSPSILETIIHGLFNRTSWMFKNAFDPNKNNDGTVPQEKMKNLEPEHFENDRFPSEILIQIFKNIEALFAHRCMQVCKAWKEAFESLPTSAIISDEELGDIFWPLSYIRTPSFFIHDISKYLYFSHLGNQKWRLAFRLLNCSPFHRDFFKYVDVVQCFAEKDESLIDEMLTELTKTITSVDVRRLFRNSFSGNFTESLLVGRKILMAFLGLRGDIASKIPKVMSILSEEPIDWVLAYKTYECEYHSSNFNRLT